MQRQQTQVFVYGTLMAGEPNHRLLQRAKWIGLARTEPCYVLLDLGAYPGMVTGGTTAVAGEVYEVDKETLAALDRLEGHPTFYRRTAIRLEDGRVIETYLYQRAQGNHRELPGGDWREAKGV